jgi:hypothetical protein
MTRSNNKEKTSAGKIKERREITRNYKQRKEREKKSRGTITRNESQVHLQYRMNLTLALSLFFPLLNSVSTTLCL